MASVERISSEENASYSSIDTNDHDNSWRVELFEIGRWDMCLLSYFCSPCALAVSRTYLDDSMCAFNAACLPICCATTTRWMVRTAYDIEGDELSDCIVGTFLPCCAVNQLLQTTLDRKGTIVDGGYNSNNQRFIVSCCSYDYGQEVIAEFDPMETYTYGMCCFPCATAEALNDSMGMPWWMGLCCNSPCGARNILRYHYRIKGNDFLDELLLPIFGSVFIAGMLAVYFGPWAALAVIPPAGGAMAAQAYTESQMRGPMSLGKYLSVYGFRRAPVVDVNATMGEQAPLLFSEGIERAEQEEGDKDETGASVNTAHNTVTSQVSGYSLDSKSLRSGKTAATSATGRSKDTLHTEDSSRISLPTGSEVRTRRKKKLKPKHLPVAFANVASPYNHQNLAQAESSYYVQQPSV